MAECNSIEHDFHKTLNMYPNLSTIPSNDQQFRLNKINEINDYFITKIKEREIISKNLSKYIVSFEYFICTNPQHFYCIFYNCYWSTCRNDECKLCPCIFNYCRICKKGFKNNKK